MDSALAIMVTFTWSVVGETLDMQDKYGQGEGGVYKDSPFSYGATVERTNGDGMERSREYALYSLRESFERLF
ncbi:MAG: hypothetical protein V8R52_08670 [Coprobacter fastidiosus]